MTETKSQKSNRVKALSPDEIMNDLDNIIPDFMIEAVNNLLKKNYRDDRAVIKQKDIIDEAIKVASSKGKNITSQEIFDEKWIYFEDVFRKAGWKVVYDKPGFNESYDANFIFESEKW